MADAHKNFAYSLVAVAPVTSTAGTSLTVTGGEGALFPTAPFNATIWPTGTQPTSTNAEIVRVTAKSTDVFTITRQQEGSNVRAVVVGDQIAATMTTNTLEVSEGIASSWSPFIMASSGQSTQTLASNYTSQQSTGSLFIFPISIPFNIQFNQIIVANQLSEVTTAVADNDRYTHYSKFGLYSLNGNTFSLITSNSFSIGESLNSVSLTWNYPTTTHTSGYGYGNFPAGSLTALAQMSSFISGARAFGLQFNKNVRLSGGMYWLGVLNMRSTSISSNKGLSNAGIIGMQINPINQPGTISGLLPFGLYGSQWSLSNTNVTGWWGRHIIGWVSATTLTDQAGLSIPNAISLSAIGATATASIGTILPTVTFIST